MQEPSSEVRSGALDEAKREAFSVLRVDHERPADREMVLSLLREYRASQSLPGDAEAQHRWLYLDNPHGLARTYVAFDRKTDTPAGLTSLFPRRVICGTAHRVGSIGGDGYVRPAFRRRGVATQLHAAALADMTSSGVEFMYGPPEPNNLRALVSAGSTVVGAVRRFTRPLSAGTLIPKLPPDGAAARAVNWLLRPSRSRLELVPLSDRPDGRVDRVFEKALADRTEDEAILPVRDPDFFAWRYARSPSGRQRPALLLDGGDPVAAVALESHRGRIALIDVVCPAARRRDVIRRLIDSPAGAAEISIHTPAILERTLLLLGFVPREQKPFQVLTPSTHPDRPLLLRPSAWAYLSGDGDVDQIL